jgi:RND family efflux transporter MFP subunit
VKVAKSKLRVAESDRRHTEEMLKYSRISAPFAGIVTKRSVDLGHLVQPPTAGTSSTAPLMILERIDMVRVFVEVPEANAAGVSPGVSVQVRVPGLREQEFSGKVVRTSGTLDVHGRTLRAQIDLQNPDNRLRPGHFVSARIESVQPGSLTIPATAVFVQNDQPMVVRIEDGKTVRTPVKLGVRQGNKVEVVKKQMKTARSDEGIEWSDFTGEEVLILANPENWANGQTVRPNHGDAQVALAGAVGS